MVDLTQFRRSHLTAPVFWARALKAADGLTGSDINRSSHRPDVKALYEEALPVAFLVRHLDIPERRVRCRYLGGGNPCDASIQLSGRRVAPDGLEQPFCWVEVTSAQFAKEHLRREALGRYGTVFGDPDIHTTGSLHRGNREVISEAVTRDGTAPVDDACLWVREAVARKATKTYPEPCLLVVRILPERDFSWSEWLRVLREVPLEAVRDVFHDVYLVDQWTGRVFPVG